MSQKIPQKTTLISVRALTKEDKDRIRSMLKRGDASKIARRVKSVTYVSVMNTFNEDKKTDIDEVWLRAIEYVSELPKVEMDSRYAKLVLSDQKNESEAA